MPRNGKKPSKTAKIDFHIRLDPDLAALLQTRAERDNRSATGQVEHYVSRALEAEKAA